MVPFIQKPLYQSGFQIYYFISVVGLPDKAVSEAKERVRSALAELAIALPSRKITINLSPADLPKEGSHFDLPIAIALLTAIGIIPDDTAEAIVSIGELSLDGSLIAVSGALPAAMTAAENERTFICPAPCGPEAAWVGGAKVIAPSSLNETLRHLSGQSIIEPAQPGEVSSPAHQKDLAEVKGQEHAKRALEIAAAGRHNLLMVGTPGSGKSMLAARMPSILPLLSPTEALETSMIQSLAGLLREGGISRQGPFCDPHHTASKPAIVGGGRGAKPGQISLAHNGVLFLDELPEFSRSVLETLRQPLETGEVMVARANAHVRYPCKFILLAAANPCRCGYLSDAARACAKAPKCGDDYLGKLSGPLLDRFDLRVDLPSVRFQDLDGPSAGESSTVVAARVKAARDIQIARFAESEFRVNADVDGATLEQIAASCPDGRTLLLRAADRFGLSARGYHRVLRVARTIADLEGCENIARHHIAEALGFRMAGFAP